MAIMGSSGSGKTTFLNYLTRNVIDLKEPSFKILHDQLKVKSDHRDLLQILFCVLRDH